MRKLTDVLFYCLCLGIMEVRRRISYTRLEEKGNKSPIVHFYRSSN